MKARVQRTARGREPDNERCLEGTPDTKVGELQQPRPLWNVPAGLGTVRVGLRQPLTSLASTTHSPSTTNFLAGTDSINVGSEGGNTVSDSHMWPALAILMHNPAQGHRRPALPLPRQVRRHSERPQRVIVHRSRDGRLLSERRRHHHQQQYHHHRRPPMLLAGLPCWPHVFTPSRRHLDIMSSRRNRARDP